MSKTTMRSETNPAIEMEVEWDEIHTGHDVSYLETLQDNPVEYAVHYQCHTCNKPFVYEWSSIINIDEVLNSNIHSESENNMYTTSTDERLLGIATTFQNILGTLTFVVPPRPKYVDGPQKGQELNDFDFGAFLRNRYLKNHPESLIDTNPEASWLVLGSVQQNTQSGEQPWSVDLGDMTLVGSEIEVNTGPTQWFAHPDKKTGYDVYTFDEVKGSEVATVTVKLQTVHCSEEGPAVVAWAFGPYAETKRVGRDYAKGEDVFEDRLLGIPRFVGIVLPSMMTEHADGAELMLQLRSLMYQAHFRAIESREEGGDPVDRDDHLAAVVSKADIF